MKDTGVRKRFRHPINMIDKFYMALHEIAHTMIFLAAFRVRGELSGELFREACLATFRRLPILRSLVKGREGWFGRLHWVEQETDGAELIEVLDFHQDGAIGPDEAAERYREVFRACSNTTWDIREEPPVKTKLVRTGEDEWNVLFLVHHAVADGHATRAVLEVFAECYNLLAAGVEPPADPIPQAPRSYLKFIFTTAPWKILWTLILYLKYEWINRPRATTPFFVDWKQREGTVRAVDLVLSRPVADRIMARVRRLGITLNEAMLIACARNVYRWIRAQGRTPGKISIAVPVNMRPYMKIPRQASVANCTVTMNINLRAALMDNAARLIELIRFQSRGLRRLRFPIVGILQTAALSWLPFRVLKRMIGQSIESGMAAQNVATMVYSNIGLVYVDEKGEPFLVPVGSKAVVEAVRFSNPVAYPSASAMGTVTYGGRVLITLSYLEPALDQEVMKAFVRGFQQELYAVMDEPELMPEALPPFSEVLAEVEGAQDELFTHQTYR